MALQLNENVVPYVEFYGRNADQMPLLIEQGRTPLSVNGLMKRRLEVADSKNEGLKNAYWLNYFDTGDAIARHSDGRVKIFLDSQDLRAINPESKLLNGGLVLTDDQYRRLGGQEFKPAEFDKYVGKSLTQAQVNDNPMWKTLARDPQLLKEYTAKTFAMAKEAYNYDENMGLYMPSTQEKLIMRSVCVRRLNYRSYADGKSDLGVGSGRLVGVAPEALVGREKNSGLEVAVERLQDGAVVRVGNELYVRAPQGLKLR